MTAVEIQVFVKSKNPKQPGRTYMQLMYGKDDFGGMVTKDVKIEGDTIVPMTSWVTGKCTLKDVRIPLNTNIISLSIHSGQNIGKIGDYELVKDYPIARGVYVSGMICKADHENKNARVIIGYELLIFGSKHRSKKTNK